MTFSPTWCSSPPWFIRNGVMRTGFIIILQVPKLAHNLNCSTISCNPVIDGVYWVLCNPRCVILRDENRLQPKVWQRWNPSVAAWISFLGIRKLEIKSCWHGQWVEEDCVDYSSMYHCRYSSLGNDHQGQPVTTSTLPLEASRLPGPLRPCLLHLTTPHLD
jgi:hypothetical protein